MEFTKIRLRAALLLAVCGYLSVCMVHAQTPSQAYIIGAPVNKTSVLGQRIQFVCEARGYPSNITYRWYKDDYMNVNTLPGYGSRIVIQGDGSLLIAIVEKEDMGWYECRPSNGVGQDPQATAFLNVTYIPEVLINRMPRSLIWALGFKESLHCPVDANPPIYNTVWTKDGNVINHQSNGRLSLLGNGTLIVESAMMVDSGNYRCTAISSFGTGDSQIVQVEVKDPPRFTLRPDPQYIRQVNQSVTMPCVAEGTPYPTITWRKVDGLLRPDIVQNIGNLTINSLRKSDHGIYECEAHNEVRKIVTSTEIVIQNTTPHAPYNISVTTQLFSATVRWIPAYSSTPQYFNIRFRSIVNNIPSEWTTLRVEPRNTTRFTIYSLQPDTLYEFKVLSKNDLGSGQFSETVRARTLGYVDGNASVPPTDATGSTYFPPIVRPIGERPNKPINVSIVSHSKGFLISWAPPITSPVMIFQYVLEFNVGSGWQKTEFIKAPTSSFLFTTIEGGQMYSFRVYSYGLLSFSLPSQIVSIQAPEEEGFGLSSAQIGGIIGGLLFLIVAITLALVAVFCNRRKDRQKRQTKYGNVKYLGPQDDIDGRPEYAPEWSDGPSASPGRGRDTLARHRDNSAPIGTDNGIFMVSQTGDMYSRYSTGDHSMYRDQQQYRPDSVRGLAGSYHGADNSNYFDNSGYPDYVNFAAERSNRSGRSYQFPDNDNDSNGFRDTVRLRHGSTGKRRSRSQPTFRHSAEPSHPVPDRPRSRGQSLPRNHPGLQSYPDDPIPYGPQSQVSLRSGQYPTAQTPVLSPVIPRGQPGYYGNPSEDVFVPPTAVDPARLGFPRHSSMKPGAQQTYLTDEDPQQPFITNDISSVLPSPFSDSLSRKPYHPYQRQFSDVSNQNVPYGSEQPVFPGQSRDVSYGDIDNTVVARQQHSPDRTMSRTLSGADSTDSNGRPFNYTRDQLLGAVEQVRRGPRAAKRGQGQQGPPWGSTTDFSDSPSLNGHGAQIPESAKPSVIVRDRPSRGYSFEQDPYKRHSNGNSANSSGTSSYGGRARGIIVADHSRLAGREDLTPDSISSGIGSRNTSSQLTGSSLHSRPSRLGSGLTAAEHDMSHDSAVPLQDYTHPLRKDISGDENYEFDSYNAVESDLLEALRNYSEVNNGNEDLMSALQEGLSTSGLMSELYPKPTRQSRYSDSEQRFEKLRGEFQKYRQQQQQDDSPRRDYSQRSSRASLHDHSSLQPPRSDSYTSNLSSSRLSGNYGQANVSQQNQPARPGNSAYRAGPMDSDML